VVSVPLQVCDVLHLSRATLSKIRQNLVWAFGYNLVSIPLAAGAALPRWGLALTPSISGALMGMSSLAVVSNSLLLQWELRGMRGPAAAGTATLPSAVVLEAETASHEGAGASRTRVSAREANWERPADVETGGGEGSGKVSLLVPPQRACAPATIHVPTSR
jgi:Cu2+-exporting ATPase